MDGDIRVRTDVRHAKLYNDLRNLVVGDSHEIFFICACLGYKSGKIKPLGKSGEDRFWSRTISPAEWSCYYAIVLKENDMDLCAIQDDKAVIARIEDYANSGMEILLEEFLADFLVSGSSDPQIDSGYARELPKELLHFLYEEAALAPESGA